MKALCAFVLAVFVLAGCKGGGNLEKDVVGTWKADATKTQMGPTNMTEDQKKMANAMISSIALDIKADKTFVLTFIMPLNGTWAIVDNKLVLTPEKKEGSTASFGGKPTMDFEVNGKEMSFTSSDPKQPGTLVMVKS